MNNWDQFITQSKHDPAKYVNPFWHPRGIDPETLAAPKRRPVPVEWTAEGQFVGSHYQSAKAAKGALP